MMRLLLNQFFSNTFLAWLWDNNFTSLKFKMTSSLLLQLVVSFIVGGCFITFHSLIAEHTNENIAGIIMMFPSTIVLV